MAVDPENSRYVFAGSRLSGLAVVDLENPESAVLNLSSPSGFSKTRFGSFPGYYDLLPANSWGEYCPISVGGFDRDNTLWLLFAHSGGKGDYKYPVFYYWTAADRATAVKPEVMNAANVSATGAKFPQPIFVGEKANTAMSYSFMLTPSHPSNRNKLVAYLHGSERTVMIYDHNGTPSDSSDDSFSQFHTIRLPNGAEILMQYGYCLAENPLNGRILIGCFHGAFEIDINSPVENGVIAGRELGIHNGDGSISPIAHESLVSAVGYDEFGRTWVGTQTNGVVGLSADYSRVVATYNTANSPLPDDYVTGIGWDPQGKRLHIGTLNGLCSVKPDHEEIFASRQPDAMFAYPEAVTPDFSGNVAIYNVSRVSRLEVRDRNGEIIAFLPPATEGITHWDLTDTAGNPVASGSYRICDLSRVNPDLNIMVVR